jgi:hypothetical protein
MALTPAQLTTLKTDILANTDQTVIDGIANGDSGAIAGWYNLDASPDFTVYKDMVPLDEVMAAIELDDVMNMTTGDNEKLKTIFAVRQNGVYPAKQAERDGFDDCFSNVAGDDSQQALIALWKRSASNVEKLFATGTGSDASPATLVAVGPVSYQEIAVALYES